MQSKRTSNPVKVRKWLPSALVVSKVFVDRKVYNRKRQPRLRG